MRFSQVRPEVLSQNNSWHNARFRLPKPAINRTCSGQFWQARPAGKPLVEPATASFAPSGARPRDAPNVGAEPTWLSLRYSHLQRRFPGTSAGGRTSSRRAGPGFGLTAPPWQCRNRLRVRHRTDSTGGRWRSTGRAGAGASTQPSGRAGARGLVPSGRVPEEPRWSKNREGGRYSAGQ